jgi:integrase
MARRASFEIQESADGWRVNIPAKHSDTGARQRRFFETKAEAEGFVRTLGVQIENYGLSAQLLKPSEAEQAKAAMRLLDEAEIKVGLLDAVQRYLATERKRSESKPLAFVIDAFLAGKKRSEKYRDSLERTKRRLEPLHEKLAADVSRDDLEKLLAGTSDSYRNALMREFRAIFSFAVKRGWAAENPVDRMDFARLHVGEREVYTAGQAAAMLSAAVAHEPELLPFVAIGLFAGVRVFELMRLEWSHVDLAESSIDLPAAITKRRRRRSIPIEAALKAWLELHIDHHGIQSGPVVPWRTYNTLRKHMRNLFKNAEVKWHQNASRHSYASYWLAEHNDINRLALHLGHIGGTEVLFTNYHRAVKRADATKYWGLVPDAKALKIVRITKAS